MEPLKARSRGKGLTEEQWRNAWDLADSAVELPAAQRIASIQSADVSPEVKAEALALLEQFAKTTPRSFREGDRIGHFVITKHLGSGGMGDVYAAQDTELERAVAVKVLNADAVGASDAAERFIREARTASSLNNPNIVTIYEVIRTELTLAIVMELVEGDSLRNFRGSTLPADQLAHIGNGIAKALAAAHASGIMHRDVKPENVIVGSTGNVKVLDFGLARWFDESHAAERWASHPGIPAGTLRYMSPEQCKGEKLTGATDIFSLGLVLYELVTGRHPFAVESLFETMRRISEAPAQAPSSLNPTLSEKLNALIERMLAKDPAQRPTAEAVAALLESPPSSASAWEVRPLQRRRQWRVVQISAAILIAIAGGLLYWRLKLGGGSETAFYQVTTLVPENHATAAAISHDGKFSVYSNVDGVFLKAGQSGETVLLAGPEHFIFDHLEWLPNGTKVIASGFSSVTNQPALWLLSVTGAPGRVLRTEARFGIPSPDGTHIAFLTRYSDAIWVMDSDGGDAHLVTQGGNEDRFSVLVWLANGTHLGFQRRHYETGQDLGFVMLDRYVKRTYESVNVTTGEVTSKSLDLWVESAAVTADGRFLFLRYDQPGSQHSHQLWTVITDPKTGAFRGEMQRLASPASESEQIYGMTVTESGKEVMVLRRTEEHAVFVAEYQSMPPRFSNAKRLTLDERMNFPHSWTADSTSVIFESNRNGSWDLFRQNINKRTPETIVANPTRWEVLPQLTPEGTAVLYAAGTPNQTPGPYSLLRVPLQGGTPQQVPIPGNLDEFRCSMTQGGGCVLRTTINRKLFVFLALDPSLGAGKELARTAWQVPVVGDWSLAADGRRIAIPNHDARTARIRVIDLGEKDGQAREHELNLDNLADIEGLVWSADGTGWFVTLNTSVGTRIVFITVNGQQHPIGDIQGWAVPSPDGRLVAYRDRIVAVNAWVLSLK